MTTRWFYIMWHENTVALSMAICKKIMEEAPRHSYNKRRKEFFFADAPLYAEHCYYAAMTLLSDDKYGMFGRLKQRLSLTGEEAELVIAKLIKEKTKMMKGQEEKRYIEQLITHVVI